MSHDVHPLVLNNGVRIPQLGFGVYKIPEAATRDAVLTAFAAGYRHVDTAALYRNERGVGEAIRESGLPRDEVFVTSKVWNDDHGYDATLRAFDASMERLGLDVLDLYLIHWPVPRLDRYVDTWRALEQLYRDGRVRAIGVSNFQPDHLRRLLDRTDVVPVVNQVELHPYLQQEKLRVAHEELGLLTEAWAPLARGGAARRPGGARPRRQARADPGAGRAAVAPAARQRGHPEVGHAGPDRGEHRGLRLRARRGRHGRARLAGPRGADRGAPRPPGLSGPPADGTRATPYARPRALGNGHPAFTRRPTGSATLGS